MTISWKVGLAAILAVSFASGASGQVFPNKPMFPNKPITLIVPYAAGGGADLIARALQNKMSEVLKQPLIIETRAGAGTTIGAATVARAAPDGYTLLLTILSSHALSAWTVADLPYHPLTSFAPIGQVVMGMPYFLIAPDASSFSDVQDLVAAARAKPGTITYAHAASGYLVVELLSSIAGIQLVRVPYKGGSLAMTAVMGGHVDAGIVDASTLTMRQGLRLLGTSSAKRVAQYPDVPTFAEQGFPLEKESSSVILMAPTKTPQAIVQQINAALREALNSPDIKQRLVEMGYEVVVTSPDELARQITRELDESGKVVKRLGLKPQ